jgi:phosphoribosylformimino-5-aminoimidazole carboxamide ribotide isomerase
MRFRPCIDLHGGRVRQIVGSTLDDTNAQTLQINFSSDFSPSYYATMYRRDQLSGGHVIMLGPGNESAALEALQAWPGGLQLGGGVTSENARFWLECGASHLIVTSWVFHDGILHQERLENLCKLVGRQHLVLDLSCRWRENGYYIVTDRWQKFTHVKICHEILERLSGFCDEFLVHAVDVEGKCMGVDRQLIDLLSKSVEIPVTYAGGIASLSDLKLIRTIGQGRIDATVGSALDIFGGHALSYRDVVAFHYRQENHQGS